MLENSQMVCAHLEYLQKKEMLRDVNPVLFDLIAEKSLHPLLHKARFEIHMNETFMKADEEEDELTDLSEFDKILCKMENHHLKKGFQEQQKTNS